MSEFISLETLTLAIPGAGRRTLLAALPDGLCCPAHLRLCVLDATRMAAPAQLALLDELAAQPELEIVFALNKADRFSAPKSAVDSALALLRAHGFASPRIWPVCASAARLFGLSPEEQNLPPRKITAQAEYFKHFAPGWNSLSALCVGNEEAALLNGSRINAEQLRLARINTGLPALEAALRAAGASENTRDQDSAAAHGAAPQEEASAAAQPAEAAVDLTPLPALTEQADCAALLDMAKRISNGEESAACKEQALDAVHAAYQAREREELEGLTAELDGLELPALRSLAERIHTGPYTVQARTPYAQRVNSRIDALLREQLDALCAEAETADAQTLARIRQRLNQFDCAEALKAEFDQRIEARQDALDVENLERITAGAESMTEKELRAVAVTLEANNWNPKFVTKYRHKIVLCRETAVFRELEREMEELNDMERRELLELRERIAGRELAPRFTAAPLAQIDERLYRMDMLRLMALQNDFDRLDFDELDALRAQVGRGDYTERARAEYLGRLREREEALVVENTDARAQLVRQLIGQYKLRMADFCFASQSEAYRGRLEAYWGRSGMEQPRDIPVFLFDNASDYAFSGERFYYKTGKELAFLPIAEIDHVQTMKQHMSLLLQVVRKDNTYLLTDARISRSGTERTLDFLNECLRRWNEPELVGAHSSNPIRTRRFEKAEYTAPVEQRLPDAALALELFRRRYDGERLREGTLFRAGEAGWEQRTARLLAGFGLPESTPIIWYDSTGLLGSARDGVAVGPRAIYWKDSKLPVQVIPLEEIYAIDRNGKQLTVTTLRGQRFYPEMAPVMVPLVEDYVRGIQLGAYLRAQETQA